MSFTWDFKLIVGPRSQALMEPSRRAGTDAVLDASDVLLLTQVCPIPWDHCGICLSEHVQYRPLLLTAKSNELRAHLQRLGLHVSKLATFAALQVQMFKISELGRKFVQGPGSRVCKDEAYLLASNSHWSSSPLNLPVEPYNCKPCAWFRTCVTHNGISFEAGRCPSC